MTIEIPYIQDGESLFRLVFENVPFGVGIIDEKGVVLRANNYSVSKSKRSIQELIGINITEHLAIPAKDRGKIRKALADCRSGKQPTPVEYKVVRPDGTEGYIEAHAVPFRMDGRLLILIIAKDATPKIVLRMMNLA